MIHIIIATDSEYNNHILEDDFEFYSIPYRGDRIIVNGVFYNVVERVFEYEEGIGCSVKTTVYLWVV